MKTVRLLAGFLYYLSRVFAIMVLLVAVYALCIILLYQVQPSSALPMRVMDNGTFYIFYPFTKKVFLLGDYNASYIAPSLLTIFFYGLFLWLLGNVFHAFRQQKLFTPKAATHLSRFYLINWLVPVLLIILVVIFGQDLMDMLRITMLHLVIGVFAFFMAAIFRQGLLLQEEQDLTF
jgi:hypothetical protein